MITEEQVQRLRVALQKCAGALSCSADGRATIVFKGEHEHFGRPTVDDILDEAGEALEPFNEPVPGDGA